MFTISNIKRSSLTLHNPLANHSGGSISHAINLQKYFCPVLGCYVLSRAKHKTSWVATLRTKNRCTSLGTPSIVILYGPMVITIPLTWLSQKMAGLLRDKLRNLVPAKVFLFSSWWVFPQHSFVRKQLGYYAIYYKNSYP